MRAKDVAKAQSAMEYLMTYGWAILIIAVVLAALFSLGVFSGANLLGSSCVASPGFLCSGASLQNTASFNGLTVTIGQNLGQTIYNIALACSASSTSAGFPYYGPGAFNAVFSSGSSNIVGPFAGTSLSSGQTITIGATAASNSITCYSTSGVYVGIGSPIGTTFTGYLWMNYTLQSGAPTTSTGTNPWYTTKIATLDLKVS